MRVEKIRNYAAPAFLVLCVLLGGASGPRDGIVANTILQVTALGLILFSLWTRGSAPYPGGARPLLLIGGLWLLIGLLYLIPLPYGLWSTIPGREPIARGFELLGLNSPSLPISLSPERSIISLLGLLPPTALFLLTLQLSHKQRRRLAVTAIAAAAVAACLGAAQIATGGQSPLRPYVITNPAMAVGFFANGNHQATLLLCALALTGFLLARTASPGRSARRSNTALAAPAMIAIFLLVGVAIVGSLAGYGLIIPVAAGTLLLYRRAAVGKIGWKWGSAVAILFVGTLGFAVVGPYAEQSLSDQLGSDRTSRRVIAVTTVEAIGPHLPLGAGLGTFPDLYRTYEDPLVPATSYVNHAHNDYLEIALETGLPGILLLLAFFYWFGRRTWQAWNNGQEGSNLERAATLVILVVLLHSIVDYPLRTAAIGAVFAMSCALLLPALPRRSSRRSNEEPALRHVEAA
jgi:O-antigen ligase